MLNNTKNKSQPNISILQENPLLYEDFYVKKRKNNKEEIIMKDRKAKKKEVGTLKEYKKYEKGIMLNIFIGMEPYNMTYSGYNLSFLYKI